MLSDFSLVLEPGTTTAIVGPSGSGKSTVLQVLAGLREPAEGSVLVDGTNLADLTADTRRDLVSVDTVVSRLPDGWGTRVGEAGTSLSGGERQRVSIARALLKPAPVLLVDEATSALDTENGAADTAALTDDPVPRTRVIVAHQLESIRAADRVVFLEAGRVVEDGTVEGLLADGGRFAMFWRQQDAAAGWHLGEGVG